MATVEEKKKTLVKPNETFALPLFISISLCSITPGYFSPLLLFGGKKKVFATQQKYRISVNDVSLVIVGYSNPIGAVCLLYKLKKFKYIFV